MESFIYEPKTDVLTTNLFDVDISTISSDITHPISTLNNKKVGDAERISIQIDWSNMVATDAVFMVKTRCHNGLSFVNEQPDEGEPNATQVTLSTASGSHIFHLFPANYQALQLFFDKNSAAIGNISVAVIVKF